MARIKQALKVGFRHLVFEDNYDTGTGDHYSLRQICDQLYIRGACSSIYVGHLRCICLLYIICIALALTKLKGFCSFFLFEKVMSLSFLLSVSAYYSDMCVVVEEFVANNFGYDFLSSRLKCIYQSHFRQNFHPTWRG